MLRLDLEIIVVKLQTKNVNVYDTASFSTKHLKRYN